MNRYAAAAAVCLALVLPTASAHAATGEPQRPSGPVVPVQPSQNGGDNGWGNCGHNSSGGAAHTGAMGSGGGNGGYRHGQCLGEDPTDPSTPPDPSSYPIESN